MHKSPVSVILAAHLCHALGANAFSQAIYSLIDEYKHSICKAKKAALPVPSTGDTICHKHFKWIDGNTWHAVAELLRRDKRHDTLLRGNFFTSPRIDAHGFKSTDDRANRFMEAVKIGMGHADRLFDMEVDVHPPLALGEQIRSMGNPSPLSAGMKAVRMAQLQYIQNLPTLDLICLREYAETAGDSYARYKGDTWQSDPEWPERRTAWQEAILRMGSFAVWAYVRGNGAEGMLVGEKAGNVMDELRSWQMGDARGMLPGLHMTMVSELRGRLIFGGRDPQTDAEWDDEAVGRAQHMNRKIAQIVTKIVEGEDDPVEAAKHIQDDEAIQMV